MTKSYTAKIVLSCVGKFGTLSELLKRNLNACITLRNSKASELQNELLTLNNSKAGDILISYPNNIWKSIKVKTSREERFLTGYWQNYHNATKAHPDYWVIVHIDANNVSHYYILTHDELGVIQAERAGRTVEECRRGCCSKGVDNVLLEHITDYENMWDKIIERQ